VLQTAFRRFYYFTRFLDWKAEREAQRREEEFERWKKLHERRLAREALLVFREGRRVNGTLVVVAIYKHAKSKDHGVDVKAYVPTTCESFDFNVSEAELREMLHQSLNVSDVALSELYIHDHLTLLADRLMYRWCRGKQIIKLSRRGNGERGQLVSRRGLSVGGVRFVVDIYECNGDLVVKTYDGKDCSLMRAAVTAKRLTEWVYREDRLARDKRRRERNNARAMASAKGDWVKCMEIQNAQEDDDADMDEQPFLLQKKGFTELLDWVLARLYIKEAHQVLGAAAKGSKQRVLMLQFEVEQEMMHNMAKRIQGMWRTHKARDYIKEHIKKVYTKRWDQTLQQFYYVNTRTGECAWTKPLNLGSDDIADPVDRWEKMTDEYGNVFYLHPLTGRSSWLSEEQAAIKCQRLWRKRQAADFRIDDIGTIIRALRFQQDAEKKYAAYPDRLSSIVNYALLLHCFEHDMVKARQLYKRAVEMAPHNPLVARAYALFLLAVCEPPRQQTWIQAVEMLRTAKRRDPDFKKFKEAEDSFFHWGVVSQPDNAQALCEWCIYNVALSTEYNIESCV
jgi:hypothetical protein